MRSGARSSDSFVVNRVDVLHLGDGTCADFMCGMGYRKDSWLWWHEVGSGCA